MCAVSVLSHIPNPYQKFQTKIYAKCLGFKSNERTDVTGSNTLLYPSIIKIKTTIPIQNLQRTNRKPMHNILQLKQTCIILKQKNEQQRLPKLVPNFKHERITIKNIRTFPKTLI
jgi:hypothetical protein